VIHLSIFWFFNSSLSL